MYSSSTVDRVAIDGSSTVDTKLKTYPRMIKIRQGGN